jgi:hypothetical protein
MEGIMCGKIDELIYKFKSHGEVVAAFRESDDLDLFISQYYKNNGEPDCMDEMGL